MGLFLLFFGLLYQWFRDLRPLKSSVPSHYIRIESPQSLSSLLNQFESNRMIRSARATLLLARFSGVRKLIAVGSYEVGPSMSSAEILKKLREPIRRMFRIPETNWSARTARLLQKNNACPAQDYLKLVQRPDQFQNLVTVPLPKESLEGYLYPDTYDIPPLLGANRIITMQLATFQKRVGPLLGQIQDLNRTLTIASLIQLETGNAKDSYFISAVIQNRLLKNMPLQIDASLLYGIGKWRRLTFKDYKTIPGPYNLYTHKGLPPTPICSPTVDSIDAALHPAAVSYIYYLALPNGKTVFATTYAEHLNNIKLRKQMIAAVPSGQNKP